MPTGEQFLLLYLMHGFIRLTVESVFLHLAAHGSNLCYSRIPMGTISLVFEFC